MAPGKGEPRNDKVGTAISSGKEAPERRAQLVGAEVREQAEGPLVAYHR